jgi:hypothetical protein
MLQTTDIVSEGSRPMRWHSREKNAQCARRQHSSEPSCALGRHATGRGSIPSAALRGAARWSGSSRSISGRSRSGLRQALRRPRRRRPRRRGWPDSPTAQPRHIPAERNPRSRHSVSLPLRSLRDPNRSCNLPFASPLHPASRQPAIPTTCSIELATQCAGRCDVTYWFRSPRIITRIILRRPTGFTACGMLAGSSSDCPSVTV